MAWEVYCNNRLIETVWFTKGLSADYVRDSLIKHDGFDSTIEVVQLQELVD